MTSDKPRMGVLYDEHALLHARFSTSEEAGPRRVLSYDAEKGPAHAREGALLADLTGCAYLLAHGPSAPDFARAALAGRRLAVGEADFEAALTGDGSLVSVPLAARCGDEEYVLLDPSPHGDVLDSWLGFLHGVEQDGFTPYANITIEDATDMLVPLLLVGAAARSVLADYVRDPQALPAPGHVTSLQLDRIAALVTRLGAPALDEVACYLALVPVAFARTLWRSLLSFGEVAPAGLQTVCELSRRALPWGELLSSPDRVSPSRRVLASWGLLRDEDDFVGARGLGAQTPVPVRATDPGPRPEGGAS
ncbi:aminomethyl transferase family protein [Thermophilibacter immobilis]|uniref:Aminomethyl transferase family protein n=1 Tax=Thermophilibacter immobilis TaxID=2779519 RepID=A0A7S7M6Q8_9ACTN|nr:aminomethyl transferase family protein [Thermophilibacter immobilis]QOY59772.1 aminomethyl transferase family protein [Thermophilibacter immobilis]